MLETLSRLGEVEIPKNYNKEFALRDVAENEKVVGTISPLAQKLFVVIERAGNLLLARAEELAETAEPTDIKKMLAGLKELRDKEESANLLHQLLLKAVTEELSLPPNKEFEIRKNWQLVEAPTPEKPKIRIVNPLDILEMFPEDCGDPNCPVHGKQKA
jgi:hypothetical protein